MTNTEPKTDLLKKALDRLAEDMASRNFGAIIWSIPDAGFHYIPEIVVADSDDKTRTVRVTGLYLHNGEIYAMEEDVVDVDFEQFYRPGIDVPPVVVTLSPLKADELFGNPEQKKGFTTGGTLEEWVAIADCYFEALNER